MPPRGYRDWFKETLRQSDPERVARRRAARGRDRDLPLLIKISLLQDRDKISPHAAAGKIADEIGGDARVRHANKKRLYGKFQRAPALYRRLALAPDDPAGAAEREIAEELRIWFEKLEQEADAADAPRNNHT